MPNTKSAEIMIAATNKHMTGFLKHYLIDQVLDKDLVTRLVVASCCPNLVLELNTVTWDLENNKITTAEETYEDARLAVFKKATFYIDVKKLHVSPTKKKTLTQPLKHYSISMRPSWSILYMLRMMQSVLQLVRLQMVMQDIDKGG